MKIFANNLVGGVISSLNRFVSGIPAKLEVHTIRRAVIILSDSSLSATISAFLNTSFTLKKISKAFSNSSHLLWESANNFTQIQCMRFFYHLLSVRFLVETNKQNKQTNKQYLATILHHENSISSDKEDRFVTFKFGYPTYVRCFFLTFRK